MTLFRASLVVLASLLAASPVALGDEAEAIAAIRRVLDRQAESWNKGDLEGFLDGYWHDPGETCNALHRGLVSA